MLCYHGTLWLILQSTSSRSAKSLHEIFSGNPTNCTCEEEISIGNDPDINENDDADLDFTNDSESGNNLVAVRYYIVIMLIML